VRPVLVDSNVLLDVTSANEQWGPWATASLQRLADEAILVINPVVYGEVSARYSSIEEVDEALPSDHFRRYDIPYAAAFLAGKVFLEYRRRGGLRRTPLPDFYIGAHAAVAGFRLLTRDARLYRTYFPRLELIAPS
jgi:predicted nucleic acid-binding protein